MAQPGGAATHYGILYQALCTLDSALTISSRGDADDPDTITFTVEPSGGGGDAVATSTRRRTVMQFKARGDHRTWSLNEIIDDALRDLYRAVPTEPDSHSEYLLITEGREGEIGEARRFFRELSPETTPDDPLALLDHKTPRRYFAAGDAITDRDFFDQIARGITSEPLSRDVYRRVWSLLSRFDIRSEQKFTDLAERVRQRILGHVDAPEDVPGKVRELFGLLLQLAAKGPQTFTLASLLFRVDLPTISLADLPAARDVAAERLETILKRIGHDASKVVRRNTSFSQHHTIFCLAGESGSGKTTLAGQIARDCVANEIVVFVSTRAGVDDALQSAADEVWKRLLGHGRSIDWESLVRESTLVGLRDGGRWLTVCLDITADRTEAARLLRFDWMVWNVRLIFTADEATGNLICDDSGWSSHCALQTVGQFSAAEAYEFLKKRGRSIAQIPDDVASLLRRPLLADIYCRVTHDAAWTPMNEYELFDAFWNNVVGGQNGRHPQDLGILLRLADTLLENTDVYPWPQDLLHSLSISDEPQRRLIQHGWLRELESTDIEFAHERFANWAVARAMHERSMRKRWGVDDLKSRLQAIYGAARTPGRLFLGYVPMDVLWMLTARSAGTDVIAAVINTLANGHDRVLYDSLLPSIGPAIVPALHEMMREERREWHSRHAISRCIVKIASQALVPEPVVVHLLEDESEEIHDTGLSVASIQPQVGSLDRLWRLQKEADAVSTKDSQWHLRTDRALRALTAAVRQNPAWIRTAVETSDSIEELRTLAWLISMLGDPRGAALWRDLKSRFLARFGTDGARGALQCIDRYDDTAEIDRLAEWVVTGQNFVPGEALAALAAIDGDRAFAIVENYPLDRVESLAAFWLPPLLLQDSARTHEAIRKRFEESVFSAASLHWDFRGENHVSPSIIAAVVKRLDLLIGDHLSSPKPHRPPVEIEHLLGVLASVNSLDGLRALRNGTNTAFAESLVKLASRYTPHHANTLERHFTRAIQQVLLRMGGEALSDFVVLQLRAPGDWRRAEIRTAVTCPSAEARQLLMSLAEATPSSDEERVRAMDALHAIASLGERNMALTLLQRNRHLWIDEELRQLLQGSPPIDDEQLSPLLSVDTSEGVDSVRRLNLLSLTARSDIVGRLIEELGATTDHDLKGAGLDAICRLAKADTTVDAALTIGFSAEPEVFAHVLCGIDTDESLDVLESHLDKLDGRQISDDLASIAAWLVTARKRHGLARLVWRYVESQIRRIRLATTQLYDAAGYLDEASVLNFLHQKAFAADTDDRLGPIRGLSHHRPEAAFDAASAALASSEKNREVYADLLMEIDPVRGTEVLRQRLIRERMALVRAHICRALRQMQGGPAVQQWVREMLASCDPYQRAAGCEAAGWFDDFEDASLRRLALHEADAMVRSFALGAVRMHQHNRRVAQLLAELTTATGSSAWGLLESLLDSAAPLLLASTKDDLWLGHALAGKPRAMLVYAQQRIDKRVEEMSRDTEDVFETYYL